MKIRETLEDGKLVNVTLQFSWEEYRQSLINAAWKANRGEMDRLNLAYSDFEIGRIAEIPGQGGKPAGVEVHLFKKEG
jgi:hypothetical protein